MLLELCFCSFVLQEGEQISAKYKDRIQDVTRALQKKEKLAVEYINTMMTWRASLDESMKERTELDAQKSAKQIQLDALEIDLAKEKEANKHKEEAEIKENGDVILTNGTPVDQQHVEHLQEDDPTESPNFLAKNVDNDDHEGGEQETPQVSEYSKWMETENVESHGKQAENNPCTFSNKFTTCFVFNFYFQLNFFFIFHFCKKQNSVVEWDNK